MKERWKNGRYSITAIFIIIIITIIDTVADGAAVAAQS